MVKKSFIQRSFQKITKATHSKMARRAVLAALIAGTSVSTISSAHADEVKPGGISILVHEFQPDDSNVPSGIETDTAAQADANTEPTSLITAGEVVEQIASLGTHDSVVSFPKAIEEAELESVEEIDSLELEDSEELAGLEQLAEADELATVIEPESSVIEKASSQFDRTIAAAVAASAAQLGISIEQVLEPFAMIGPIANEAPATMPIDVAFAEKAVIADEQAIDDLIEPVTIDAEPTQQQLAEAVALNRWWLDTETVAVASASPDEIAKASVVVSESKSDLDEVAAVNLDEAVEAPAVEEVAVEEVAVEAPAVEEVAQAEPTAIAVEPTEVAESTDSIEAAIDELAAEEPLDVQEGSMNEGDEKLVGSSPMIVTIQDAYMPYDLAQRDLELNLLPLTTVVPISPENYVESSANESLPSTDEVAVAEETAVVEAVAAADEVAVDVEDATAPAIEVVAVDEETTPVEEVAAVEEFAVAEEVAVAVEEAAVPAIEMVAVAEETTPVEENSVEPKIVEAKIEASPDCLLGELVHDAGELANETQIRDLTFAGLGESFGEWVASLSPKRAEFGSEVAPAMVVGSAVLSPASTDLAEAEVATTEVAEVPESAPESAVVAVDVADVDVADDAAVADVTELAMMEVDGQAIAAPVADPIPNAEEALEIAKTDSAPVMEVDGEIVPAPVADPAPNASDASDQIAVMEVDGRVIPAPVADPLPNAEPEQIASSKADSDEMAVVESAVESAVTETVVATAIVAEEVRAELAVVQLGTPVVVEPEANIADLIATINQWQREAINAILASPVEVSSEVGSGLATELASDDTQAEVASPEASEAVIEVAEKVEAPSETTLR